MEHGRWKCVRGYRDWGVGGRQGLDLVSLYYLGAGASGELRCGYSCQG